MTEWVHCNNCFRRPGNNLRFFLTNCAHIFCEVCIEKVTNNNKCSRCHKSCTTIPLTSQLKPDVEIFFQDPVDILKKHQKQLTQILEFQQNHRQSLASHQKQEILKQESMLAEANKGFEKLKVLENEIKNLSDENKYLRSLLEESPLKRRHGTPAGHMLSKTSPAVKHRMTSLSQSSSPSLGSPYSPFKLKVNRSQDGSHTPQMIRTPQGPARISLRTPPINGRLGTTPGSSGPRSSGYPKRPSTTPGGLDLPMTPGLGQASPMITSPMYNRNSGDGVSGGSRLISSSQSQSSQSQIRRYMMDNKYTTKYGETSSRTPIQLRNTHHKPLISTPHSSQPLRT